MAGLSLSRLRTPLDQGSAKFTTTDIATVTRLEGMQRASAVVLLNGDKVACDMIVAGVGAAPVTEVLANTGLEIDNGIVVIEYLETKQANVHAAGDVANYFDRIFDKRRRVEHWDNAVSQGQYWATLVRGERHLVNARRTNNARLKILL